MSTKEMTQSEMIAAVTEVEVANKKVLFNYLTKGMEDWKMPIKATVPIKDFYAYADACAWFTGTELYVVSQVDNEPYFNVAAKGYYMMGE